MASGAGADTVALHLSRAKALQAGAQRPGRLVIGADQTLCLESRVLGKPAGRAAAAAQLAALSGRTHELYSGCCVTRENTILFETVCVARLSCRKFSPAFIETYMAASGGCTFEQRRSLSAGGSRHPSFRCDRGRPCDDPRAPASAAFAIPARGRKPSFVTSLPHSGPKACVIGWPVAHSRSPLIHRFWLESLKIAGSYELAAVAPADFPDFVGNLARHGFVGAQCYLTA